MCPIHMTTVALLFLNAGMQMIPACLWMTGPKSLLGTSTHLTEGCMTGSAMILEGIKIWFISFRATLDGNLDDETDPIGPAKSLVDMMNCYHAMDLTRPKTGLGSQQRAGNLHPVAIIFTSVLKILSGPTIQDQNEGTVKSSSDGIGVLMTAI